MLPIACTASRIRKEVDLQFVQRQSIVVFGFRLRLGYQAVVLVEEAGGDPTKHPHDP